MFGSDRQLSLAAAEPSEPELATIAGLAAVLAAVPSALMTGSGRRPRVRPHPRSDRPRDARRLWVGSALGVEPVRVRAERRRPRSFRPRCDHPAALLDRTAGCPRDGRYRPRADAARRSGGPPPSAGSDQDRRGVDRPLSAPLLHRSPLASRWRATCGSRSAYPKGGRDERRFPRKPGYPILPVLPLEWPFPAATLLLVGRLPHRARRSLSSTPRSTLRIEEREVEAGGLN